VKYCFHRLHKIRFFLELHLVGASVAQIDSAMYFFLPPPSLFFYSFNYDILSESDENVLQRHSDDTSFKE
jgi:hypothetical protein